MFRMCPRTRGGGHAEGARNVPFSPECQAVSLGDGRGCFDLRVLLAVDNPSVAHVLGGSCWSEDQTLASRVVLHKLGQDKASPGVMVAEHSRAV